MSDSFILAIAGNSVVRPTANLVLNRLHRSVDEYDVLEFSEVSQLPGAFNEGSAVTLTDAAGNRRFQGQITSRHYGFDESIGWTIGYTCLGLKYLGNLIAVTNPHDQSGFIVYNLPPTDPAYVPSNSGLSVGEILTLIFQGHSTQLTAAGIQGFNSADLTPLSLVPTETVTFDGPALFDAIDGFLAKWYPSHACFLDPNGAPANGAPTGQIRVMDTNAFAANTLTLGTDPVDPVSIKLSRDLSQCFTRVVYRGQAWAGPAYLSTADGTLTPAWTATEQADWSWSSFMAPTGAVDSGTVSSLTTTSATVSSSSSTETWTVNQWSNNEAWLYLINPVATGLAVTDFRQVTANTAMSAGGSATISWSTGQPLASTGYTQYHLIGQTDGSESDVWRRYNINNSYIANNLMPLFPEPVPWGSQGSITLTPGPAGAVCWAESGSPVDYEFPAQFQIDQIHGQIRFFEPVVKYMNLQSNLDTGGSAVTAPADVKVVIPYSRGPLQAVAPGDTGGSVVTLTLTAGGSGYTSTPTVQIWGNGSGAAATATVVNQVVTALTLTSGGSEYSANPTVIIEGGGGSGATATATVSPIVPVYSGSAYSTYGIARTYYIDDHTWIDPRNGPSYQQIASNHLAVLQNPVVEGSIEFLGVPTAFDPLTLGYSLNLAGNGFTTGWESLAACVRGVDIEWQTQRGGTFHKTTFHISNRRKLASGDAFYIHPAFAASSAWSDPGTLPFEGTAMDPNLRFELPEGDQGLSSNSESGSTTEANNIGQPSNDMGIFNNPNVGSSQNGSTTRSKGTGSIVTDPNAPLALQGGFGPSIPPSAAEADMEPEPETEQEPAIALQGGFGPSIAPAPEAEEMLEPDLGQIEGMDE